LKLESPYIGGLLSIVTAEAKVVEASNLVEMLSADNSHKL